MGRRKDGMKSQRLIEDIDRDAFRTGALAGEWGWSAAQWARAVAGMRRLLRELGAGDDVIERIVRKAQDGYESYAGDGEEWLVVRRATGALYLQRARSWEWDAGDELLFRGARSGAVRVYTMYGGLL